MVLTLLVGVSESCKRTGLDEKKHSHCSIAMLAKCRNTKPLVRSLLNSRTMSTPGPSPPVVVISGASSGIGEELALLYSQQGAKVVLSARRVDKLEGVASKCRAGGACAVEIVPCDVSKEIDCKSLISQTVQKCGGIDILILNAGVGQVFYCEIMSHMRYGA